MFISRLHHFRHQFEGKIVGTNLFLGISFGNELAIIIKDNGKDVVRQSVNLVVEYARIPYVAHIIVGGNPRGGNDLRHVAQPFLPFKRGQSALMYEANIRSGIVGKTRQNPLIVSVFEKGVVFDINFPLVILVEIADEILHIFRVGT